MFAASRQATSITTAWPICASSRARAQRCFTTTTGRFHKVVDLPDTAGVQKALWLDYDHDYDLDLLLFGPKPVLMRNNGNGKFEDHTAAFPFVKGQALDAVAFAIRGDTAARDIVVSYADRAGVLYRDKLNGVFEAADLPALAAGASAAGRAGFQSRWFARSGQLPVLSIAL